MLARALVDLGARPSRVALKAAVWKGVKRSQWHSGKAVEIEAFTKEMENFGFEDVDPSAWTRRVIYVVHSDASSDTDTIYDFLGH